MNSPLVRIEKGRVLIPDCLELLKQAEFYRKQLQRQNQ